MESSARILALLSVAGVALGAASFVASGQTAQPEFEVAVIRECRPEETAPPSMSSPRTLSLGCWYLWRLISDAYVTFADGKSDPSRLVGATRPLAGMPDWANSSRFTVEAKTSGAVAGAVMRGPMMRRLLEERFQLSVQKESRETAVYLMTVGKSGLGANVKQSIPGEDCTTLDPSDLEQIRATSRSNSVCNMQYLSRQGPRSQFETFGMTMKTLAGIMNIDGLPIVDKTGLTGFFHIRFEWDRPEADPGKSSSEIAVEDQMNSVAALQKQTGLQLVRGKALVEELVIEHIERLRGN